MIRCELCNRKNAEIFEVVCEKQITYLVCEFCQAYLEGDCPDKCSCADEIEQRNDAINQFFMQFF